jgi:hypothetical protein
MGDVVNDEAWFHPGESLFSNDALQHGHCQIQPMMVRLWVYTLKIETWYSTSTAKKMKSSSATAPTCRGCRYKSAVSTHPAHSLTCSERTVTSPHKPFPYNCCEAWSSSHPIHHSDITPGPPILVAMTFSASINTTEIKTYTCPMYEQKAKLRTTPSLSCTG